MKHPKPILSVYTNGCRNKCYFCGQVMGVQAELDFRFGHTEVEARSYGWFPCCGRCYAKTLCAPYSNRAELKPKNYRGYRP